MIRMKYREAVRAGIREALTSDSRVFLMGEDVGRYGGTYACSHGLLEEFGPERVRDTPLSESTFVGAGDGIVQNGGPFTRNKVRTAPLWGMRIRTRLMHDGLSLTPRDAILRHDGEARFVINNFRGLSDNQKNQLLVFLRSL